MPFKKMSGKEFVKKILAGERNFRFIKLEKNFDLYNYEGFNELQEYLKKETFISGPLNIGCSELIGLNAPTLWIPFIQGRYANLKKANLEGAKLARANLKCVNLYKANLRYADFVGLDLKYQDYIKEVDTGEASWWGRKLAYYPYHTGSLGLAYYTSVGLAYKGCPANLGGSSGPAGVSSLDNIVLSSTSENITIMSNLKKANLEGAKLMGVCFDKANLKGTNLTKANLEGARFYKANLAGADFREANLAGAHLYESNFKNANLDGANLEGTKFKRQTYSLSRTKDISTLR